MRNFINIHWAIIVIAIGSFNPGGGIIHAQSDTSAARHFVLPEYTKGIVKLKDGRTEIAILNYNMITEEMVFEKGNKRFAITGIEKVDTIFLGSRKFIPYDKEFLEILIHDSISLLIRHKRNMLIPGSPAGYGGTTETGAAHSISHLVNSGNMYKLDLPSEYHLTDASQFWLYYNRSFVRISTERQLLKLIPAISNEMRQFIDSKKLGFRKQDDVCAVIKKCNSLMY